ncbi:1-deoxypentalenic acid 11-beta-hydroxylase-like [Pecten maximus]|uniref:1-deoxypentalenic acid 11-beta-hydroxylase-like n=1 Tax=Pecten maximus TaxID=6579 RepID=UPI001458BD86|nr:1-deoxypentalenic acid 11-beta-hydroxylase-like [Pecten maximus]
MAAEVLPPGFTAKTYPEVFTQPPTQPKGNKPGQLTKEQLDKYFDQGYLLVENFFDPVELEPCQSAINDLVNDVAEKLYKAGKTTSLYGEFGFEKRLIEIEKAWPGAVMLLLKLGKLPQAFRDLWSHDRLLNVVEQIVGPEISAHAVWNLRPKAPGHTETLVPWHQDSAYFDVDTYNVHVCTAWIPFVNTTKENGCMEFATGGHKKGLVGVHQCCENFYLMLDENEMEKRLDIDLSKTEVVEAPLGSILLFNNVIPHRSIPNVTDSVRWSVDFRWQDTRKPWGFYGLKKGIPLRSAIDHDIKPDWDEYDKADRYKIQKQYEIEKFHKEEEPTDEFDVTITGPWFEKYHVTKHNEHVDAYNTEKENKTNP